MTDMPRLTPHEIAELLHELRTPLGGLRAMCELLEGDSNPDAMSALRSSIDHLEAIANRVLAAEPVASRRMSVKALLAILSRTITSRASSKKISLNFMATPTAEAVEVDATPFRQVLENLLENALRLQQGGSLEISVHCRADGRLGVSVRDEGPGVSDADARRLIAEGGAIAGRKGGAGLGLSICGKLVSSQDGLLSGGVREDGLPGAEFRFDWPGRAMVQDDAAPVLIVDDHPASRQVLRVILAHLGVRAIEAEGVEAALALSDRHAFRVVITDLNMEAGGGKRLIETLRMRNIEAKIAVVSADQPDMPVDAFVMKPISVRAIAQMLRQTGALKKAEAA